MHEKNRWVYCVSEIMTTITAIEEVTQQTLTLRLDNPDHRETLAHIAGNHLLPLMREAPSGEAKSRLLVLLKKIQAALGPDSLAMIRQAQEAADAARLDRANIHLYRDVTQRLEEENQKLDETFATLQKAKALQVQSAVEQRLKLDKQLKTLAQQLKQELAGLSTQLQQMGALATQLQGTQSHFTQMIKKP